MISLVFWTITIVVTIKYVALIMRADNDGEGGIMALIALLLRLRVGRGRSRKVVLALAALGIFGAALFFGDSMITPAISVLSAVEGLEIVAPSLHELVVPIAAAILIVLVRHPAPRHGRGRPDVRPRDGAVVHHDRRVRHQRDVEHPGILRALSPTYAVSFFADDGLTAFLALGGVVLAVTGAEALYADMGHFGRSPIRRAWFVLVFPALTLNYLGQGALLLDEPAAASNPFFLLIPHWARLPMVFVATLATIIASQSVISGAFSVTHQAVRLGYLPRLRVTHTSQREGQIYVPFVNWTLLTAVLIVVFAFEKLGQARVGVWHRRDRHITITTLLFFVGRGPVGAGRCGWSSPARSGFGVIDLAFLGANLTKIASGGWLPLLVAAAVATILFTWQKGRVIVTRNREELEGPLREFVAKLHANDPPIERVRVPRSFSTAATARRRWPCAPTSSTTTRCTSRGRPVVETVPVPYVADDDRLVISDLGFRDDGISHVTARFGFQEMPNVPEVLRAANERGLETPLDVADASYFLSKIELVATTRPA